MFVAIEVIKLCKNLAKLKDNMLVINACRGEVIDNQALLEALQDGNQLELVLDVWENEPTPNSSLVERVDIATPHIAGYSVEAKRRAITHVLGRFRKEFDLPGQEEPTYEDSKALKITNILKDDPWATVLKLFPLCNFSKKFKMSVLNDLVLIDLNMTINIKKYPITEEVIDSEIGILLYLATETP